MKKLLYLVALGSLLSIGAHAQVTIGSGEKPVAGALLDLKEYDDATAKAGGRNAEKGLGLPRVKLTVQNALTDIDGATGTGYEGLMVYNVSGELNPKCAKVPDGLYVWDGSQWQGLGVEREPDIPLAPTNPSQWLDKVWRHPAKSGVYEEFISADFGPAGRWMTTNLAVKAYDGIAHSQGNTLENKVTIPMNTMNTTHWAYPSATAGFVDNGPASAEYTDNPYLGLLYTWDAATAGKGGSTGTLNIDNPASGNPSNDESGFAEWDGTGTQPANTQKRRQGICPAGWHLPSDYEWTILENVMQTSTSKYSTMPNIEGTVAAPGQPTHESIHIGTAMKDVCGSGELGDSKSNPLYQGGFSAIMPGSAIGSIFEGFGNTTFFWTSSSYNNISMHRKLIYYSYNTGKSIYRDGLDRYFYFSVRCVKD